MDEYLLDAGKKERFFRYITSAAAIAAVLLFNCMNLRANGKLGFFTAGPFGLTFAHLPTIILAGFFGYIDAMIMILLMFLYAVQLNISRAYMVFIFLIVSMLSYEFSRRKWYRTIRGTIAAFLITDLVVGNGWYFLICLVSSAGFSEVTAAGQLALVLMGMPENLIACIFLRLFFTKAPEAWKERFYCSHFYTKRYREWVEDNGWGKSSRLGRHVAAGLVIELAILMVATVLLSGALVDRVIRVYEGGSPGTSEETQSGEESFGAGIGDLERIREQYDATGEIVSGEGLSTRDTLTAIMLKLFMMLVTFAAPLVAIANYIFNKLEVEPLRRLSTFMVNYAGYRRHDKEKYLGYLHEIRPAVKDEIYDVYEALDVVLRDINDYIARLQEEQALKEDLKVEKASNEAKSEFLSEMSHEIRTPVNAVLGMDEMILRESREDRTLEYAADIRTAGRSLLSIINDILDFSKIEAGRMEIVEAEYHTATMIRDLASMIRERAEEKHLSLFVNADPALPSVLWGDEVRIRQCVLNLLTNAVKYTKTGSVTMNVNWKADPEAAGEKKAGSLTVEVEDTGIGIRPEDMDKLFAPFERIENDLVHHTEGTGLGLGIVRRLLDLMGSSLQVRSTYGRGSTFWFTLHAEVVDPAPVGEDIFSRGEHAERKKYHESFRAPSAKILVVDDTEMNLKVVTRLLGETQVRIDTARSGYEALERTQKSKYDVIFIDHRMPGIDGIETMHRLREDVTNPNRTVPCIALTANAMSGAREEYLRAGFRDYLSKPVRGEELEATLLKYLPKDKVIIETDDADEKDGRQQQKSRRHILILDPDGRALRHARDLLEPWYDVTVANGLDQIPRVQSRTGFRQDIVLISNIDNDDPKRMSYLLLDPEAYLVEGYSAEELHEKLEMLFRKEDRVREALHFTESAQ